ncbi:hypothetical protein M422DRAFT_273974 [Sphaerobolus stellatus SS14]|uniref:DUF6589 domain-containing protein n=1 Tax=Sphaerobolus stellatus (strain SS14) TaxID=990650 RepID=A0A0C9UI63_SPHS4|nr:hypothetical protein M422DRAFT_273974 [Sphaerobolus stellatus SS14]
MPPWKTTHELLYVSAAGHIQDVLRTQLGVDSLTEWAKTVSQEEFTNVVEATFNNYFTSQAIDRVLALHEEQDNIHINTLLYNQDVIIYIEFCDAIRTGDIERVVNVLRVWMVMMRGENHMPKYADAIFETLNRLHNYPDDLRDMFLDNWLEHQNFWGKVIFSAKGSNKSWDWMGMITSCIFALRDAMWTVQGAYKITPSGTKHTVPSMILEISKVATYLKEERLHVYVKNRAGNDVTGPVTDLLAAGMAYPNTAKAFRNFVGDRRYPIRHASAAKTQPFTPSNAGGTPAAEVDVEVEDKEEEEGEEEDNRYERFEVDHEDLRTDPEEFVDSTDEFMAAAVDLAESLGYEEV